MSDIDILVSEVGLRDGLQSIKAVMPTRAKKAWIDAAAAAGVREIEVASFVPPKLLPQMADAAEIVAYAKTIEGLDVVALVPNFKGAENAIRAGADKLGLPLSCSETHSQANLKKTHDQVIDEVRRIAALLDTLPAERRPGFEGSLSTAFGCTLEGEVAEAQVVALAVRLVEAGVDELSLSDTTGYANPTQLRRLIRLVRAAVGADKLDGVHLHNTRGLGLANVVAALEEGITTVDSSLGGIGGCPFAPGASGNIVTEDLVFMLDSMGLKTGIDLDKLLQVREIVLAALPDEEMYGFTPEAGLPKGYTAGGWGIG
ncbi:MAG: hydroxymethylglutaryl-CoA lyase [Gammaproteobacteria bacterium]|jgi:hydroxymethylglutaryl-CoA lyase|nr:hydroxymethylglutaryl-CoA lyase [Gammaproteobacteria bacterium]MDP7296331.1 hydroxymethylglutaryl-CoA lyase [Gammaproteobacteria bacterium]MDP7419460.1 hydroxymethylglutaryl-CoA lyase [Gammaproteobacteria bacterium]MDP7660430.1 hydroxymethylglutaryl-CoA lyase [Gammaproteobacteria bacterium]HJP39837.1 hydroxymethylglutaryl-CoA lyase [Gammaproteobacteria bacterium]